MSGVTGVGSCMVEYLQAMCKPDQAVCRAWSENLGDLYGRLDLIGSGNVDLFAMVFV